MFRLDVVDAHTRNPYRPRATRRPPGNVPYVVDNLWEWRRPADFPSRRQCVCVSPRPELAERAGGTINGRVFRVEVAPGAKVAQIPQWDARIHPDVKSLPRLLLELLGPDWLNGPASAKSEAALLWVPCLATSEVEELFRHGRLGEIRERVWNAIELWQDARLLIPGATWPYPEGEVFFEASEWRLLE